MTNKPATKATSPITKFGEFSLGLLVTLTLVLCCPSVSDHSDALEPRAYPDPTASIAIALDQEATMDITPNSTGAIGIASNNITIKTTGANGYSLYLNTLDNNGDMKNTNSAIASSITSTTITSPLTDLSPNTWGYNLNAVDTNYHPIPTTSDLIYQAQSTNQDTLTLNFGAKLDTSLPAGQYASVIQLSAVATPRQIQELQDLTYMQDMTSSICANTRATNGVTTVTPGNEVEKQLIDARDGKEYWVAKLADQNCWMTQNLALDLNEQTLPLTPEMSDVSQNWTPNSYTETTIPGPSDTSSDHLTRSWNLGKYVLATPTRAVNCHANPKDTGLWDTYVSLWPGQNISEHCTDFVNVAGDNWQANFDSSQDGPTVNNGWGAGIWQGTNFDLTTHTMQSYTYDTSTDNGVIAVKKSSTGGSYDAHYLIGNYYLYDAATAGTGSSIINAEATDSICPRNWQLPTSNNHPSTTFANLFSAYGMSSDITSVANNLTFNIATSPLYFVRSGHTGIKTDYYGLIQFGAAGLDLTAYATATDALTPHIGTASLVPEYYTTRTNQGLPIRCLAR